MFRCTYFLNCSCFKSLKCPLLTAQFLEPPEQADTDPLRCFAAEIIVSATDLTYAKRSATSQVLPAVCASAAHGHVN